MIFCKNILRAIVAVAKTLNDPIPFTPEARLRGLIEMRDRINHEIAETRKEIERAQWQRPC